MIVSGMTFERWFCDSLHNEVGFSVQQTHDGGYIIAGWINYGFWWDQYDVLLLKVDSFGNEVWTKVYGDSLEDKAYCVRQCADGNYIVAGATGRSVGGNFVSDVYLLKLDSNGDTLWTRKYGGDLWDEGKCVIETKDTCYVIVGSSSTYGGVYLLKTNALGNIIWSKIFVGGMGESIQETNDGGYIIAGWSLSSDPDSGGVLLIKTDSIGNMLWRKLYGGQHCAAKSVQQTVDGGYIICGHMADFNNGGWEVWLLKTDILGDTVWTKKYGGYWEDWGYAVVQTLDTCYFIAGHTWSFGAGGSDVYLIKTDINGDTKWTKIYGGSNGEHAYSAQQTLDKGYIVVGSTESFGAGHQDVYLIKTDSMGVAQFMKELSPDGSQIEISPNPFRNNCSIILHGCQPTQIRIYNIAGQIVRKIPATPRFLPLYYTCIWYGKDDNGKQLPSGVYLLNVQSGNRTTTKKLIFIR